LSRSPPESGPHSALVLPVLPALLSTTGTGGRRQPIGVVLGLAVTFTTRSPCSPRR
jgi:hypothetical protein